jgi:hypothetical protein
VPLAQDGEGRDVRSRHGLAEYHGTTSFAYAEYSRLALKSIFAGKG